MAQEIIDGILVTDGVAAAADVAAVATFIGFAGSVQDELSGGVWVDEWVIQRTNERWWAGGVYSSVRCPIEANDPRVAEAQGKR